MELLPSGHAEPVLITPELMPLIRKQKSLLQAWKLSQQLSGLDDKVVYSHLGVDASHWTKINNGSASPPADERFTKFMRLVKNDVLAAWIAEAAGKDWLTIRSHESEKDRLIAVKDQRIADLERLLKLKAEVGL